MSVFKEQFIMVMKDVMCVKDKVCLGVVCMVLFVIKQIEVDECIELDDECSLVVFDKLIKQCKDFVIQYCDVGWDDFVDIEEVEIEVLQIFLFVLFSEVEVDVLIDDVIV